jgi:hypothetical protein
LSSVAMPASMTTIGFSPLVSNWWVTSLSMFSKVPGSLTLPL